jgi:hypothetical protein
MTQPTMARPLLHEILMVQGNVQGLFYVASADQLVCCGSDSTLTTLAEDSEGSEKWKVLTTMRFSLQNRARRQDQAGAEGSGSTAAEQLLFCWTGVFVFSILRAIS